MALVTGTQITTAGTGASDHVALKDGTDYVCLIVWAGSAGDLDLQVGDGTSFTDVLDSAGSVVNVTSSYAVKVPGGMNYRVDVNTHTSAATITFHNA